MTKSKIKPVDKKVLNSFHSAFKHPNPYPKDWLPGPDGKRPIDKA